MRAATLHAVQHASSGLAMFARALALCKILPVHFLSFSVDRRPDVDQLAINKFYICGRLQADLVGSWP